MYLYKNYNRLGKLHAACFTLLNEFNGGIKIVKKERIVFFYCYFAVESPFKITLCKRPVCDQGFSFQPFAVTLVGGIDTPEPDQNQPEKNAGQIFRLFL